MNSLQLALTISAVLCVIGFFGYTYQLLAGNVTRFTRWKDLTVGQWILFLLAVQGPMYIIGSLLFVVITR